MANRFHIPSAYRIPLAVSVALHLILIIFLAVHLPKSSYRANSIESMVKIINAVAVHSNQVQADIETLKAKETARQQAEAHLREMALAAEKRREQEQNRLEALQAAAIKKREEEALKLKTIQDQAKAAEKTRVIEEARVAALQAEQLHLQEKVAQATIAKKKAEQQKAEQQKAAQAKRAILAAQKLAQEKKVNDAKAANEAKANALLQKQKELQQKLLADQMAAEEKQLQQATQAAEQGILDRYKAQIIQAIEQQWIVPEGADQSLSCVLLIRLGPNGVVLSVSLVQSSGDVILDRSAQAAVFKASPLPVPKDPNQFAAFRELRLTVRPLQVTNASS